MTDNFSLSEALQHQDKTQAEVKQDQPHTIPETIMYKGRQREGTRLEFALKNDVRDYLKNLVKDSKVLNLIQKLNPLGVPISRGLSIDGQGRIRFEVRAVEDTRKPELDQQAIFDLDLQTINPVFVLETSELGNRYQDSPAFEQEQQAAQRVVSNTRSELQYQNVIKLVEEKQEELNRMTPEQVRNRIREWLRGNILTEITKTVTQLSENSPTNSLKETLTAIENAQKSGDRSQMESALTMATPSEEVLTKRVQGAFQEERIQPTKSALEAEIDSLVTTNLYEDTEKSREKNDLIDFMNSQVRILLDQEVQKAKEVRDEILTAQSAIRQQLETAPTS